LSESNEDKPNKSHPNLEKSQGQPPDAEKASETSDRLELGEAPPATRKRGRPTGKRSNPDYTPVTAYVKSETYRKVKVALLMGAQKQEFSELLETLLSGWLENQNTQKSEEP
jgi:hypothetical protein